MNITRHNYEEYFILYTDNELGIEERRMVETFVEQHPELKAELDLLSQYKLVPDIAVVYDKKEELKKAWTNEVITLSNYDEWLMLYIDNELTASQKITVEKFIAAHPSINNEFVLLQRTQLQQEEVVFTDKASLYRKEEKVHPIPIRWWRLAAAAVLLLGISIATAVILNNKDSVEKGGLVKGSAAEKKSTLPVLVPQKFNGQVNETNVADNNTPGVTPAVKQVVKTNPRDKANPVKDRLAVIIVQPVKDEMVVNIKDKKTNDLPTPLYNPNIIKNNTAINAVTNTKISNDIFKPKNSLTNPVVTTQNPSSSEIVYASNHKTDVSELEQSDGKKNKNRGIFRKIARTFEKRTDIDPTEDNRLLVAGLSIKLK